MAHPHTDHVVHQLPSMILRAMRDASLHLRTNVDREALRHLSRLIGRATHAGHDTMAVMHDYVSCIAGALARDVDWNGDMEDIDAATRAFMHMPFASPSTFEPGTGRPAFPADLIAPLEAWTAARVAEEDCDPNKASADIRAEMERVAALFPRVGLSYGYIGNCSNSHDDRGFMLFTQVEHRDGSRGTSTRFGDHAYAELPKLRTMVLARLEDWARTIDQRIEAGTMLSRAAVPAALDRAA